MRSATSRAPVQRPDDGFSILQNVVGRHNDHVLSRTGRRVHPARFDALFKYEAVGVRRFCVQQDQHGAIRVLVEMHNHDDGLNTEPLRERIRELVNDYPVTLEVVEAIPPSAAGKHRQVMSAMTNSGSTHLSDRTGSATGDAAARPHDAHIEAINERPADLTSESLTMPATTIGTTTQSAAE